jgi:hypothetical protein
VVAADVVRAQSAPPTGARGLVLEGRARAVLVVDLLGRVRVVSLGDAHAPASSMWRYMCARARPTPCACGRAAGERDGGARPALGDAAMLAGVVRLYF